MIGVGYVGLVTATCFADLGHRVVCRDINPPSGWTTCAPAGVPIYEPGVDRLLERNRERLTFTLDMGECSTAAGSCSCAWTRRRCTPATPTSRACTG